MPNLNEMIKERNNKKFAKKNYRPWDLTGEDPFLINSKEPVVLVDKPSKKLKNNNKSFESTKENTLEKNTTEKNKKLYNKTITEKETNREQLDNKTITEKETNREQLDINLDPESMRQKLINLSGIQKNILNFIVDLCTYNNKLETGPIQTDLLVSYLNLGSGVIKTSIKRLIDKGFILRNKGKRAKGGYISLSITPDVYNAEIKRRKNHDQTYNSTEFVNAIRYQLDNKELHSSSSYNKNTTTTINNIPKEWDEINFEALTSIGFSKTQIKQLVEKNEPSLVQEAINHFSFGIENNPKFKKYEDPLNVLMGVLRKGHGWIEKNYQSPKEIAQQELLKNKKEQLERKMKFEEEAYKLALNEWTQSLISVEIERIAPSVKNGQYMPPQKARLDMHFREQVWPAKKTEYLLSE